MSLLRSRRSIHFLTSSRYAGCGVTTSSAFIRSIGTILRMPVIGLALRSPTIFSSLGHHLLDVGVPQREHACRHAGHPVDVEHVDRVHQVAQLALGSRQDQHVAQLVRAHRLRVLREGLEQPQHLAHADVAQRHDLHREAGGQRARRVAELGRQVAADGGRLRHDHVQAAASHHRRAVHPQQRLERRGQRVARDARGRADRDGAAHRRVDRVVLVEDVAQDVADDFAQLGALEIQHDVAAGRLHGRSRRQSAARLQSPDDDAGALVEVRLQLLLLRRRPRLRAGRGLRQRGRQRRRAARERLLGHRRRRVAGAGRRGLAGRQRERQRAGEHYANERSFRHGGGRLHVVFVVGTHAGSRVSRSIIASRAHPRHRRCW